MLRGYPALLFFKILSTTPETATNPKVAVT
jgi:hypothetical protein